MLAQWVTTDEDKQLIDAWSQAGGLDLWRHGTESDAATITDTAVAQPLICATSLMSWRALTAAVPELAGADLYVAGHSVGEFAASAVAGVLTPEQAIGLVATRGRAMAECAAAAPTGMAAVVGGEQSEVIAAIEAAGLTPANINGGGQVVAAGPKELLGTLGEHVPAGARVKPLAVAGAFHTAAMEPARPQMAAAAAGITPTDPPSGRHILTNSTGREIASGRDFLDALVHQVASPVHWDKVQQTLLDDGVTAVIELAPAGVLAGIARRVYKGKDVTVIPVKTPADIDTVKALFA
jgi:[acyl-carrier-protein] S-malonyltransferase